MIKVGILNKSNYLNSEYIKIGNSDVDVKANIQESIQLKPLERRLILTGLYFEIPSEYEIQVKLNPV